MSPGLLPLAIESLEEMGLRVYPGLTCSLEYREYLAGHANQRAQELNAMFADQHLKAIFSIRGGYGSAQLLPRLDYGLIHRNPKLLIGYSDITALHTALLQKAGLPTIHGPMPASDLVKAGTYTKASLVRLLSGGFTCHRIANPPGEKLECLIPGTATGILAGGNLSVICSLMGTPFELDTTGKILFLEEVNEEPYKLDRMMTQLALAGKFRDAAGIILGTWSGCAKEEEEPIIKELMRDLLLPFGKPVIFNLRAGHCEPMVSLPLGFPVEMQAESGIMTILESCHAVI